MLQASPQLMSAALWSFEVDHSAPATYLADGALLRETTAQGLSPSTVRSAIEVRSADATLNLELIMPDGSGLYDAAPAALGDMLLFHWLPIFSDAAYRLLLREGCAADEFIECRFRVQSDVPYKLHVPLIAHEVIDFARSVALHSIPLHRGVYEGRSWASAAMLSRAGSRAPPGPR